MKKIYRKIRNWLMLVAVVSSFAAQPLAAVAQTMEFYQTGQTDQETKHETSEQPTASSEDTNNSEEAEIDQKRANETSIGESQNANDSPSKSSAFSSTLSNEFLNNNQLIQGEDGKLYTTTASNYTEAPLSELSKMTARALTGNSVVYTDPNAHVSNIDIHLSNGNREYGWYGKRVNGEVALCIEQGVALNVGSNGGYTSALDDRPLMRKLSLIKYYGIVTQPHTLAREIMTQLLAWEQQGITPTSISGIFSMADYQSFKSNVMANVDKFYTIPSFDSDTINLKVGETKTITDTTSAFSNYESQPFNSVEGINIKKQGSKLSITATEKAAEKNTIYFQYDIDNSYKGVTLVYEHPYTQNVMIGRVNDPAKTSINVNVEKNGNAQVKKVDADTGKALAGAKFKFTTSDGKSKELTTDSNGLATWEELLVGTEVTIQEIKAADGYILNKTPQTIKIKANETTTVTFSNKEQLANLTVIKEDSETGNQAQGAATLIGATYELTDANDQVVATLTMKDVAGVAQAQVKGLKLGTYFLTEVEPPEGYTVDPTKYKVDLTYAGQNETVAVHRQTVTDQVIKGTIDGYKFGSRPLLPQTLDQLMERVTTSQAVKPPLEGVELTATAHATGQTYVVVTGENGYFKFADLPYDTYTIEETKGIDGFLLIEPFDVTISEEGQTHFFLLEDRIIESKLHIVKVDEETGENIPYAGAQFKIFDTWVNDGEGAFVTMQRPNDNEETDLFETNAKGEIVTTESLAWGKNRYELHEVKAPEGYVALEEPIVFSVTEDDADGLIRLEVPNRLARQDIELIKRDRLNEHVLADVPFELYQVGEENNETLIGEYQTDEAGTIEVEGLPYGDYRFKEGQPLAGYLPLEDAIDFSVTVEKDGQKLVLEAVNEREDLEITTLFADVNGEKVVDPTKDNRLKDRIWLKGDALEIGHTYTIVTRYKNTKTGKVVSEDTTTFTPTSKEEELSVSLDLPANTLKQGDQLTATHELFYEEEQKNKVGEEDDLTNKDQTITLIASELPKAGSTTSWYLSFLGVCLVVVLGTIWYRRQANK